MSKLLTVFGATGNQGGSVIKSILANPQLSSEYKIRAITRDPSKPSGKALADKGVEVVKADLKDKDSVKKAVEGSSAVFGVTNCMHLYRRSTHMTVVLADMRRQSGSSFPRMPKCNRERTSPMPAKRPACHC